MRWQANVTLAFLMLDHLGGVDTVLSVLSSVGTLVLIESRDPDVICRAIEEHRVEVLPTSPTFLNLMLVAGANERHDLSSLRRISYGTEPMPETTLKRLVEALPGVELHQTYGMSELGALRTRSRDNDSLWLKVGGEGFETKVVDGTLWIRARSAMLGYLNQASPFDEDGWYNTGDAVEVDGDYVRILGRRSEVINVGGDKVHPTEVESVVLRMPNVKEAVAYGEPNPLMGQVVAVRVVLCEEENPVEFRNRLRKFCREQLPASKVPVRITLTEGSIANQRMKTVRRDQDA